MMECPKCGSKLNVLRCCDVTHGSSLTFEPGSLIPTQVEVITTKLWSCSKCSTKITTFETNYYNKEIKYNRVI